MEGRGSPPPPPGAAGLRHFTVVLPDDAELERVMARVKQGNVEATPMSGGVLLRDPSGNGVMLTVITG